MCVLAMDMRTCTSRYLCPAESVMHNVSHDSGESIDITNVSECLVNLLQFLVSADHVPHPERRHLKDLSCAVHIGAI